MRIEFTKMHGLGNDFMVIDNTTGRYDLQTDIVRALADRHHGVGFDQMLVVAKPSVASAEFDYRIYNADGAEVEHCGNGARCFAAFVRDKGLTDSTRIPVNTCAGMLSLEVLGEGQVKVLMGVPVFDAQKIPVNPALAISQDSGSRYALALDESAPKLAPVEIQSLVRQSKAVESVEFCAVAIGNPHIVIPVNNVEQAPVNLLGPWLESHPMFANRINVGFMQVVDNGNIRLRVFERGVGETNACGSGACAALAVSVHNDWTDSSAKVHLNGGTLTLDWPDITQNVEMTGPCTKVFEGQIEL